MPDLIFPTRFLPDLAADPWHDTLRLATQDWLQEYGGWTRDNLTAAVCEWPENMGCRLLFADHQEKVPETIQAIVGNKGTRMQVRNPDDRGGAARADFVRVQCQIHALEGGKGSVIALQNRERIIWSGSRGVLNWVPIIPGISKDYDTKTGSITWRPPESPAGPVIRSQFRRGFLESLTLPAEQWLRHWETLTAEHPIREVTFTDNSYGANEIKPSIRKRWPRITFSFPSPGWAANPAAAISIGDRMGLADVPTPAEIAELSPFMDELFATGRIAGEERDRVFGEAVMMRRGGYSLDQLRTADQWPRRTSF